MKYAHILLAAASEIWAIQPEKLTLIMQFLMLKADGGTVPAEEVARVSQKAARETSKAPGSVGVLSMVGVMGQRMNMMDEISGPGGVSTMMVTREFRAMMADDSIKAVVLDIDSPGGQVFGTEELGDEVFSARGIKPIVAQVNSTAASAAYWVASQADEIAVTPGGRGGSIGVYTIHDDVSKMLEAKGVVSTVIASHPNKVLGHEFEPLSEAARQNIEGRVQATQKRFSQAVARGRNVTVSQVNDRMGNGLTFDAEEMVDLKMADRVATLDDTMERFGASMRPAVMHQRASLTLTDSAQKLRTTLLAGEQPTIRLLEDGLRGSLGYSKREAERAAAVLLREVARGDPEVQADHTAVRTSFSAIVELANRGLGLTRT